MQTASVGCGDGHKRGFGANHIDDSRSKFICGEKGALSAHEYICIRAFVAILGADEIIYPIFRLRDITGAHSDSDSVDSPGSQQYFSGRSRSDSVGGRRIDDHRIMVLFCPAAGTRDRNPRGHDA